MKQLTFSLLCATIATLAIASSASAAGTVTCTPIYGGGQSCIESGNILINKKVSHPKSGAFVENLTVNDEKYAPEQTINFQITISNNGGSVLGKVAVQDVLPAFVTFVAGPGNYNANTKTLSFDVLNLNPGESRTFTITGKVVPANQLPSDKTVICDVHQVINQAIAIVDGQVKDEARFCIQKGIAVPTVTKGGLKVFPPAQVKTTPPTGPEMFALAGLFPTGLLGYFLRKKAL